MTARCRLSGRTWCRSISALAGKKRQRRWRTDRSTSSTFFFIIPKNHFEVSLFFPTSLCGVLVFDSVSLPLLRPLLLFVNHHLCHTIFVPHHLSHTSLSHTICHRHLCQPPSFTHDLSPHLCHTPSVTHIFVNHHLSHTPSFTRIFVTHHLSHTSLSTTIFVTHTHHLSHTSLSTTIFVTHTHHLSHRSLSTTIFVTPSLSHTICHTHLCQLPSFTHHLSHTSLSTTIFVTPSLTHIFVTHQAWHLVTSISVSCGRRHTW